MNHDMSAFVNRLCERYKHLAGRAKFYFTQRKQSRSTTVHDQRGKEHLERWA